MLKHVVALSNSAYSLNLHRYAMEPQRHARHLHCRVPRADVGLEPRRQVVPLHQGMAVHIDTRLNSW